MYLERDEERILQGEYGETRQKMIEILVALGRVFEADRLIPIASAQVSGASYKTIGEWGLRWLESLDARVAVPTVLNPIGMPREGWEALGIRPEFAEKQEAILEAYHRLGVKLECTCTPYYLQITNFGDHLAWAESSAVVYANSVLGARTNREGGPGALAAGILGKTPRYGMHLLKNRRPQVSVVLDGDGALSQRSDLFGALGYLAGRRIGNRIPIFSGIRPRKDELKLLGAAMAATGAVSVFHVEGITPEARIFQFSPQGLDQVTIEGQEVEALFSDIDIEAVAIGCPHCSVEELEEITGLLKDKTVKKPLFIFSARAILRSHRGLVEQIERSGAQVIADTCMVVSPFMERYRTIMVDSGKAFTYVPDMCGALARIGTRAECIEVATH